MANIKEREIQEHELDLRQKLVNNLLERQKLVNEAKGRKGIVRITPQDVLIQRRHSRLAREIDQLHKQYANILD
jgi:sugar-specific transcriptional regulator TrmB